MAYLAIKHNGARDWASGLGLSLTHQGRLHFIQWHHIFPKSLLKLAKYETGATNEIANMGFITGNTNRRISNRKPADYLAEIVDTQGKETLAAQLVPTDLELWEIASYRSFLEVRRSALAECMNRFVAQKAGIAAD